ncbi:hypothetical protein BON22_4985 [Cyberlindnera fabianii]|uniref:Mitochondrial group I intron splicing factor CCM1 n=1 Tax=Cyberlindnera fabianii TaxID=36022 RepID=A0A1V2L099_CYBFA|nr:hypothetical protein BON22_4985 [Cyberlindnera fabianii]
MYPTRALSALQAHRSAFIGRTVGSYRLVASRLITSWFKKKPILEGPNATSKPADPIVLEITQRLRTTDDTKQLSEMLVTLGNDATPGSHSFALMNEVIKKLDKLEPQSSTTTLIPGMDTSQCFDLFKNVSRSITVDNYRSARFMPRLYLQITKSALAHDDTSLLLSTLGEFIHYLNVLGFENQLVKVLDQFYGEFPKEVTDSAIIVIRQFVQDAETPLHPSLTLKLLDMHSSDVLLYQLCLKNTVSFLENVNADDRDAVAIREIVSRYTNMTDPMTGLEDVLKICELASDTVSSIEYGVLKHMLTADKITTSSVISIAARVLEQPLAQLEVDSQIWRGQLISKLDTQSSKMMSYVWDVFDNGLTSDIENKLIESNLFTEEYLQLVLSALVNSRHSAQYTQLLTLFDDLDLDHSSFETYTTLMRKFARDRNTTELKRVFQDSMSNGVDWSGQTILNKFFTVLAEEEGDIDPQEVFSYVKKIKLHLGYLDPEAYNALVTMALKNRLVDDAIESLKRELPPLAEGFKYKQMNYPQLYDTIFEFITETPADAECLWSVYEEFINHFEIPFEWYFPIIKSMTSKERPDLAFNIFQTMKRIHRTTGSIPPPPTEIYTHLFKQFGRQTYVEGVETLDAIFKVDLTINSSIPLLNSIMDAYCSIKNFTKVSHVYEQICCSPSGPNNETVSIMLKAHTFYSLDNVKNYWNNMDELGLLPDQDNFKRYIVAHCYHGQPEMALQIAKQMDELDVDVSPEVVKSLYQWTKDESMKQLVEQWAETEHKSVWEKVKDEIINVPVRVLETPSSMEELGPTQEELRLIKS